MRDLVSETQCLARNSSMTVSEICKAAGIKSRWYHKFIAGEFKDPGVSKVQRLHEVLKDSRVKAA